MAVKVGGEGLGGGHKQDFPDNSEINVTPFVDIMLVLLIIFMVAAPLATVDVKVDLPKSTAEPESGQKEPVYVSIQGTGRIYLMNNEVSLGGLPDALNKHTLGKRDIRVYIRADKGIKFREVMRVMNTVQDQGYYKVALVGEESTVK